VGVIPEDWEVLKAAQICELVVDCKNRTPPVVEGVDFAVVRTPNVRSGKFVLEDLRFTDERSFREWTARAIPQIGDVLITREAPLGEVCLVPPDFRVCLGQRMMLYRPDKEKIESRFLLYVLMATGVQENLLRKIGGSTVGHAKVDDIRDLQLPIPTSRSEQEAIAEALSDADYLIESLEQLLVKKRHLKQGAMQELLTGKKRLPGFTEEWVERNLGQMGKCYRGVSYNPGADLSPFDTELTIRLLRSNNVQSARIEFSDLQYVNSERVSEDQQLQVSDVLICMANGSRSLVGKAGRFMVDDGFAYTFGAFMGCFRPNGETSDPSFVFYLFQTEQYRHHIAVLLAGSSINNLTPTNVEAFEIRVPSQKPEQIAIATVLSDMDAEIATLETKLTKARQLKQGMMQELLTGRIRLV
jgi:type I restriction enzyme S subunit